MPAETPIFGMSKCVVRKSRQVDLVDEAHKYTKGKKGDELTVPLHTRFVDTPKMPRYKNAGVEHKSSHGIFTAYSSLALPIPLFFLPL